MRSWRRSSDIPARYAIAGAEQAVAPVTAQKILDYRVEHGAFRSVDELDEVPGIGPTRIEQLKGLVVP
jgi:competence ComEA-like helix-hairpin-helix protein